MVVWMVVLKVGQMVELLAGLMAAKWVERKAEKTVAKRVGR